MKTTRMLKHLTFITFCLMIFIIILPSANVRFCSWQHRTNVVPRAFP